MTTRVMYISYDGLLDPLGQSQVLPYIRELARRGVNIRAISFEKPELAAPRAIEKTKAELAAAGVRWHPLPYHRRPTLPATAWDILRGISLARSLAKRESVDLVHARSYIAGIIALAACRRTGAKFLFDMRGFWPDERVEGGGWKKDGLLYRSFKAIERRLLAGADGIVSLTRRGADILERDMLPAARGDSPPVAVIPTCADLDRFLPVERQRSGVDNVRLIYLGSLGSWYMLEQMLAFFSVLRKQAPGSTFRILTGSDPGMVERSAEAAGIGPDTLAAVSVETVPHERVPEKLAAADCSIFFIRPTFSKQASCATKFAESLACGVPVVINSGVGDHDRHVRGPRTGVVLDSLDEETYRTAAVTLTELLKDPDTASRCRTVAEESFSLAGAVEQYLGLYERLTDGKRR
ncbi:MAG: glycosyltransferase family 4 protein [Candidatus Glassbacteria bacterium]|nr:glycosyltransferase family 4 protein [Candidatus Glassbacteria bacterium]